MPSASSTSRILSADFMLPNITSTDAKLLYFLNFYLEGIQIEFGAGIFVDIDKKKVSTYCSTFVRQKQGHDVNPLNNFSPERQCARMTTSTLFDTVEYQGTTFRTKFL
jgi:hypothetical protein